MLRQIETTERMPLLDKKGALTRPSWAVTDVFEYNKDRLRRPARRKEWEFYQLSDPRFTLQLTYGHAVYVGMAGATLLDRETGRRLNAGPVKLLPGDAFDLDFSAGEPHSFKYEDGAFLLSVGFDGEVRRLRCVSADLDVDLACRDEGDAIVTAVPFARRGQFYYNYKKNFSEVRGRVIVDGLAYPLEEDAFLLLDSGRGVWPYRHHWVWGNGTARVDGHVLGLNIGWGFGNTSRGTENALFWDGKIQKLGRVREEADFEDFMQSERFYSEDGRLELAFTPVFDNFTEHNWLAVHNRCHQVFGTLSGRVTLDDGTPVAVEGMRFFCEHAQNRW